MFDFDEDDLNEVIFLTLKKKNLLYFSMKVGNLARKYKESLKVYCIKYQKKWFRAKAVKN